MFSNDTISSAIFKTAILPQHAYNENGKCGCIIEG